MKKTSCISALLPFLFFFSAVSAQNAKPGSFFLTVLHKDTVKEKPALQTTFSTMKAVYDYVNVLPRSLAAKGFATASVDSVWQSDNTVFIQLYTGVKYSWINLRTQNIELPALSYAGYRAREFRNRPMSIAAVDSIKQKLLRWYENNGYPFAAVYLDSVIVEQNNLSAVLMSNKSELYRVDSLRNFGKLKINNKFLQRYLDVPAGSPYNRQRLLEIDNKLNELPYAEVVQPSSVNMVGSGSVLNLNLNPRRSSQISAILGLLPETNNTGKFLLTGDVNLDLKNVFGSGEGLLFRYQALQPKSPRLNLGFDKPYIFKSPYGAGFLFDLYKRDSAFLNLSVQGSFIMNLSAGQTGSVVLQYRTTSVLQGGIDTNAIRASRRLPENIDVNSVNAGLTYERSRTDYRFNPRRGTELSVSTLAGLKKIRKNADIVALKSPGFNYESLYDSVKPQSYQVRFRAGAAKYFAVAKSAAIKLALNTGIYASPDVFRNEVFQIGGYRLLRGFDEEGIFATKYGVVTTEYRYLLARNSYVFGFIDAAYVQTKYEGVDTRNGFVSTGGGILYETKAGLLNLSLAIGKRNDVPFNFRGAAKIHFGYINYF